MTINKKGIAKLSPEERIKKLKLMGDERKKEVEEIEELIKKSMQELKTEKLAEEISPEPKAVDISRLFETISGQRLERTAREEASPAAFTKGTKGYQAFVHVYQDYSSLKKIMGYAVAGSLSEEQLEAVDKIGERLDKTKYESASSEIANLVVASRAALHKIRKYAGM